MKTEATKAQLISGMLERHHARKGMKFGPDMQRETMTSGKRARLLNGTYMGEDV